MGFFGLFSSRNDTAEAETEEKKVVYQPTGLTMTQRGAVVGGAFLSCMGLSYGFQYVLYVLFGSACVCVAAYDSDKFVNFINDDTLPSRFSIQLNFNFFKLTTSLNSLILSFSLL